jgi:copper homeostasis protein
MTLVPPTAETAEPRRPIGNVFVEVCVGSLEDARFVHEAGWQHIELNSGLPLGGLTPSVGMVEAVIAETELSVIAMCRPRPGGFFYSQEDWRVIERDVTALLSCGVAGIAIGVLEPDRSVAIDRLKALRQWVGQRKLVFHRAFDLTSDLELSLEALIEAGVDRVLTSGGQRTAWEGREMLQRLARQADGRIEILMGSGINPENCCELVEFTKIPAIHGSFSTKVPDLGYDGGRIRFAANDDLRVVDREQLRQLAELIQQPGT